MDNPHLENIYELNFKMYLDSSVIVVDDIDKARTLIKTIPNIACLIADHGSIDTEAISALGDFLLSQDLGIPVIEMEKQVLAEDGDFVVKGSNVKELLKYLSKTLGVTAVGMSQKAVPKYVPFKLDFFLNLEHTPCDIFEYIDEKLERVFRMNEKVDPEKLDEVKQRKVKSFYILSQSRLAFVNILTQRMIEKIDNSKKEVGKMIENTSMAMEFVAENIKNSGLDENSVKLAKKTIKEMHKLATDKNKLGKLFRKLLDHTESYLYQFSELSSFVSCHIISNMDWGSEEQQEKIVFLCFFNDILLTDEKLLRIRTKEEFEAANLNDQEKDLINRHAQMAVELLQSYPRAPMGADIVVKQHHGSKIGLGLPETFPGTISPLAIVLGVAETFVDFYIKGMERGDFSKESAILYLQEKFPEGGKAKNAIDALRTLVL
jgi:response regulator RpfG family c-di-GMP phosphodiesterase